MEKVIAQLKKIADQERGLRAVVAKDALQENDPMSYLQDVVDYGCITGLVGHLIYYRDTHRFFDEHYDEIEALREEYEDSTGLMLEVKDDLKNFLAWFAYEETVRAVFSEIS